MHFIPPLLAGRLEQRALLADARYIAEPKLDGQRAQIHVAGDRTRAAYSRPGRELLRHRGLGWLRDFSGVNQVVLDGELFSGDGAEGIDAILVARGGDGANVAFAAFDVLQLGGRETMAEPWADRRKRLEDLVAAGIPEFPHHAGHHPRTLAKEVPMSDRQAELEPTRVRGWADAGRNGGSRRDGTRAGRRAAARDDEVQSRPRSRCL
jgi:ATP-dependent DNA ligase